MLLCVERDELYQVSFHILILSGRREKTLMEKVSLSISLSVGLLRNEAFTPFIAELRRFQVAGPDRKSVRPVSDMNLHPSMTGDSTERPGENRRID